MATQPQAEELPSDQTPSQRDSQDTGHQVAEEWIAPAASKSEEAEDEKGTNEGYSLLAGSEANFPSAIPPSTQGRYPSPEVQDPGPDDDTGAAPSSPFIKYDGCFPKEGKAVLAASPADGNNAGSEYASARVHEEGGKVRANTGPTEPAAGGAQPPDSPLMVAIAQSAEVTAKNRALQAASRQAGMVKGLAGVGAGDSPPKAADAGSSEVRLMACLRAWATAEEARLSLEAGFGAVLAQKEAARNAAEADAAEQRASLQAQVKAALKHCQRYLSPKVVQNLEAASDSADAAHDAACLSFLESEAAVKKLETASEAQAAKAGEASLLEAQQLRLEGQRLQDRTDETQKKLLRLATDMQQSVHVVAHLKEKVRSIQGESEMLITRLEDLDLAAKVKQAAIEANLPTQEQLLSAQQSCSCAEAACKSTMKDFSHVTEPTLIREYQRLVVLKEAQGAG